MAKLPWAEKHRPTSVKDYTFQDEATRRMVLKFIEEQDMPHLILTGTKGTGKTSLAYVLKNEFGVDDMDFLKINASLESSVDMIRSKVLSFVNTMAMGDTFKIILLDEADLLSPTAQGTLRGMMEDYASVARFILTGNKPHKIIDAVRDSRCFEINFKAMDKDAVFKRVCKILKKEGVDLSPEDIGDTIEMYIDYAYPDFRKLLTVLQVNVNDGVLSKELKTTSAAGEFEVQMLELMEQGKWGRIRTLMSENTPDDRWEDVYRFLYDYLPETKPFSEDALKIDEAIITVADHLYRNALVADPEINFAACIVKLGRIAKK